MVVGGMNKAGRRCLRHERATSRGLGHFMAISVKTLLVPLNEVQRFRLVIVQAAQCHLFRRHAAGYAW